MKYTTLIFCAISLVIISSVHAGNPCPKRNQVYMECGPCVKTCDNYEDFCNQSCGEAGCYCNAGYVLIKGECRPYSDCNPSGGVSGGSKKG